VEVALVGRDGSAWGTVLDLGPVWSDHDVAMADLEPVSLALLPRPYPQFLPYLVRLGSGGDAPRVSELDGLQFAVSADLLGGQDAGPAGFEIERVTLILQGEETSE
jgi:hypothetical protein